MHEVQGGCQNQVRPEERGTWDSISVFVVRAPADRQASTEECTENSPHAKF